MEPGQNRPPSKPPLRSVSRPCTGPPTPRLFPLNRQAFRETPPGTVGRFWSAGRGSNRRRPEFALRRRTSCARASSFVDGGFRFRRAPVQSCECRVLDCYSCCTQVTSDMCNVRATQSHFPSWEASICCRRARPLDATTVTMRRESSHFSRTDARGCSLTGRGNGRSTRLVTMHGAPRTTTGR
jgi:hypothetical protein